MNAFIYARSSTSEQQCKHQITTLKQYARKNGIKVVGTFSDISSGNSAATQPGLQRMVEALSRNKGAASSVFCWHLTRISRRASAIKALRASCPDVEFVFLFGGTI